jgi:hypothetical protein
LGILATITLEADAFAVNAPLLPFFKCILEVVLCEDVHLQHRLCSNSNTSPYQNGGLSVSFSIGETE